VFLLTNSNQFEAKTKASFIAGNKCHHAQCCNLKKRYKTPSLNVGLYKIIRRSIVVYCAELWNLTNEMESVNDVGMENTEKNTWANI